MWLLFQIYVIIFFLHISVIGVKNIFSETAQTSIYIKCKNYLSEIHNVHHHFETVPKLQLFLIQLTILVMKL